jgi:phospholipid transport system substrate-binding protein
MYRALIIIATMSMFSTAQASEPAPGTTCGAKTTVEAAYTRILNIVKSAPDNETMRAKVNESMEQFVDFPEFGKLSLGKRWKTLDEKQQKIYLEEFQKLLKRTYLRRFDRGKPFTVAYRSECVFNKKKTRVEVRTSITSGDVTADVDYRFHQSGEKWLVYDIVVDEVSVMRNYRSSFVKVLKNEGFDVLIDKMKKKKSDRDE